MNKKLSHKTFILSQVLLLITGLLFVSGLYYFLNYYGVSDSKSLSRSLGKGGPITKEPASLTLDLTGPDDESLVFQKEVEFSGKTSPNSQILVSSDTGDQVVQSKADGNFSMDFTLDQGVNELKIIVFDKNGDQKEVSRTVYYSKEKI